MSTRNSKRVKDITGMQQVMLDLKPDRCDSDVYINQKMNVTNLVKYIEEKKQEGKNYTYFHAFVTALAKTFYNRNKLNRFVSDRHIFEHNDIVISFVAKTSFEDKSEELMVMIPILPDDNIDTISKKILAKLDGVRTRKNVKKQGANNAIDVIAKIPNVIRIPLMGIVKWMDKKGILPKSLVKDNIYYSSLIVSNLGSIHCGAIYHNITNFGTCSGLVTMGEIKNEEIYQDSEKPKVIKVCEFGINLDERIADGYYFAKSCKILEYILANPETLEENASTKINLK